MSLIISVQTVLHFTIQPSCLWRDFKRNENIQYRSRYFLWWASVWRPFLHPSRWRGWCIPAGEAALDGVTPLASLHPSSAAGQASWTKSMPGVRQGSPRTPQDFAPSPCSPCHSRARALLSWAPFPLFPLPHHPNFAASGLNRAGYHRRTHRGCWTAPECKKSMQPPLLIKGCPVGTGPADPGWLLPWLPPATT